MSCVNLLYSAKSITLMSLHGLRNLELLRAKVVLKKSRSASIDGIFGLSSASLASLKPPPASEEKSLRLPPDEDGGGGGKPSLSSLVCALG
jgi:hypothetical protein